MTFSEWVRRQGWAESHRPQRWAIEVRWPAQLKARFLAVLGLGVAYRASARTRRSGLPTKDDF